MKREASDALIDHTKHAETNGDGTHAMKDSPQKSLAREAAQVAENNQAGIPELIVCVGGIYASFLSWALLQERITTTAYGDAVSPETWTYSIFLNTVQSAFAACVGYIYLLYSSKNKPKTPPIFPTTSIIPPLLLVSVTSSLASPFGYASLKHVGYITFILAKSCKLLPVMALHISVFRKRYPLYKYAVVSLVTAGVAVFTLQHPSSSRKSSSLTTGASPAWGLTLLAINLLFDGLTNSTQDYINASFTPFSGSQMMCAQNIISTGLTTTYLLVAPYLASSPLGSLIGLTPAAAGEFVNASGFIARHPSVGADVLMFAACGAVGQVFIFYTLAKFSSLLLVTITVTRKMLTMLLSVVWFGHSLGFGQWVGVGLVFGGVGAEAAVGRWEKAKREKELRGKKKA